MKRKLVVVSLAAVAFFMTGGCQDKPAANMPEAPSTPTSQIQGHGSAPSGETHSGTVLTTMDGGIYTYVEIDEGGKKIWAVGPRMKVVVGDKVEFRGGMPMPNYHSRTLNRTFESILFVSELHLAGSPDMPHGLTMDSSAMPPGHPGAGAPTGKAAGEAPKAGSISKAKDGYTVEELFSNKDQLNGKTIAVRGKVVKFSSEIMGKNWVHLQDGTGTSGANDLTVTTDQAATAGDTILVQGTLRKDKDFGAGYLYNVIIEDAKITLE